MTYYRTASATSASLTTGADLLTGTNSLPQFVCEMALGNNPGDASYTWTDVSAYLRSFHISRGRQYELNAMQASTCDIVLKNLDRRFEPGYSSSPYYPNIRPMVPVRMSAVLNSNTYILFTGFVERFPQNRTGPSYAETQIQAVDGFELLTNATLPGATYPSELTGARIGRVLDAVSWSTSARSIATGQSTITSYSFLDTDNVVPLAHIQDVELSELGTFFITNDGRAKFQDRRSLGSTNQATFTDQPSVDTGDIGYSDIVVSYDKDYIYNSWSGTRSGGVTQTAINTASISQYFLRTQSRTPLLTADGDVLTQMEYLAALYAQPNLRVESITVIPGNSNAAWLQALSRDLTDRISVLEHPPGGGTTLVQDSYIQQIDLTVPTDPANTRLVYSLLPAATNNFWQASISAVGTDTRAGY